MKISKKSKVLFVLYLFFGMFQYHAHVSLSEQVYAQSCPSNCSGVVERFEEFETMLKYLQDIRQKNSEFIQSLKPDQKIQKMKALSNISIADKRIAKLNGENKDLQNPQMINQCKTCEESS